MMRHPFPNHFHEHYVIGLVEGGRRVLSCKNKEYTIEKGSMLLFNPGDNHACVQKGSGNLDYRGLNIEVDVMLDFAGKKMPEVVGADVFDRSGNCHLGIIEFPVPILKGNANMMQVIRQKLYESEFSDLLVVDFSDVAQGCKTYDAFIWKMTFVSEMEFQYLGIAICGAKKKVNKLTGAWGLLRYE